MHFDQVEGEIFALVIDVKLLVAGLFGPTLNVLLDSGRNLRRCDVLLFATFFRAFACFCPFFLGMLRVLLGQDQRSWCEKHCNRCCENNSCDHRILFEVSMFRVFDARTTLFIPV